MTIVNSATVPSPSILIVEDARADRARFRLLLERQRRSDFEFAWRWAANRRANVREWFLAAAATDGDAPPHGGLRQLLASLSPASTAALASRLGSYELILLDLAWSGSAEQVMQSNQHLTEEDAKGRAHSLKPGDWSDLTGDPSGGLFDVEGVVLLEWLMSDGVRSDRHPTIWVTSAYVPETALGLRTFLRHRYAAKLGIEILHKWLDETAISTRLGVAARRG